MAAREQPERDTVTEDESPYARLMSDEDRAILAEMSGDLDLTREIELFRQILTILAKDTSKHHRDMHHALTGLLRAISLQLKVKVDPSDLEQLLQTTAEEVRGEFKAVLDALDGPRGDSL